MTIQASALLDWDYTEDAVGNPTHITETITGQSYTAAFTYQAAQYFLTQGNGPWSTRNWTYDRIGSRLTHQESGEPPQTYTYAGTGHNPKLLQITPAPGLGSRVRQYAYDAAGNQISVQRAYSYSWQWRRKVAQRGGKMSWLCKVGLKRLKHRWLLLLAISGVSLALLLLGVAPAKASKKMRALTHSEVSQGWVEISEDELYIFRLHLADDGGGYGAYSFLDNEAQVFRVSNWKYEPPLIRINIAPTNNSTLVTNRLSGKLTGVRMHLRRSGAGWSRSLSFRREDALLGRWNRVKAGMSSLKVE